MEENQENIESPGILGLDEIQSGDENTILGIEEFDQAEGVFQFDNDEPITIAWSSDPSEAGELNFILKPNSGSSISFQSHNGEKTLRIFSRRLTEERREELESPTFPLSGI